jgi:menaquinol-cytochrome c reductase iron-sulfur subunit
MVERTNQEETAPIDPTADISVPPRRNFIISGLAVAIGAVISLFPLIPGAAVLLDPVLRRKKQDGDTGGDDPFVLIAKLESVPTSGAQQYPVIDDRNDAWNRYPDERIGAVYLRRTGEKQDQVQCFNAVCPHLGCIYSYVSSRNEFYCPCHNSAFHVDGSKLETADRVNPSPRPLDELEVDPKRLQENGEVWVKFENFYTGTEEKIPKP